MRRHTQALHMWTTSEHRDANEIGEQLGSAGGFSDGLAGNAIRADPNGKDYSDAFRIAYSNAYLISYEAGLKGRREILGYDACRTNPPGVLARRQDG